MARELTAIFQDLEHIEICTIRHTVRVPIVLVVIGIEHGLAAVEHRELVLIILRIRRREVVVNSVVVGGEHVRYEDLRRPDWRAPSRSYPNNLPPWSRSALQNRCLASRRCSIYSIRFR